MISRFIVFKILKWKVSGTFPSEHKKVIVLTAPHTSMMDFVMGWFYFRINGMKANFLIKEELFFFPLGILLRKLGSIPVKRGKVSLVDQMVEEFAKRDQVILNITPEGTRQRVTKWKRGFYKIAEATKAPIILGFVDYKKKTMGVFDDPYFEITGNEQEDIKRLKDLYRNVGARHPERFSAEY
jgi:1-acyl-sn-glycerol-3-phosphate acyltransferase